MNTVWSDLHQNYQDKDWIDKPSIFAETAIQYFPGQGSVLELGAGQGQDSRFFAEQGYEVLSTDIEDSALEISESKLTGDLKSQITLQKVDLSEELPFGADTFDVVYAHLSLHYFDYETTTRLFHEIQRVLKPGGVLAFLANSTSDPEYGSGQKLEEDYYQIRKAAKRYFSVESARQFTKYYEVNLLDDLGETYKDTAKGVHNLVRFVGHKPLKPRSFATAVPFAGAIIERTHDGKKELLMQTRWKPGSDPLYSGTLEFPAGVLDKPYEDVFDTVAREVQEEAGLKLRKIIGEDRTKIFDPNGSDAIQGFRPFCCTQQLQDGKPWIGFIFIAEVEDNEPVSQLSEAKDAHWMPAREVRNLFETQPDKLFGLELPAWEYYFQAR